VEPASQNCVTGRLLAGIRAQPNHSQKARDTAEPNGGRFGFPIGGPGPRRNERAVSRVEDGEVGTLATRPTGWPANCVPVVSISPESLSIGGTHSL
jgi:hypothetical protein